MRNNMNLQDECRVCMRIKQEQCLSPMWGHYLRPDRAMEVPFNSNSEALKTLLENFLRDAI